MITCPMCAEEIAATDVTCPHCGSPTGVRLSAAAPRATQTAGPATSRTKLLAIGAGLAILAGIAVVITVKMRSSTSASPTASTSPSAPAATSPKPSAPTPTPAPARRPIASPPLQQGDVVALVQAQAASLTDLIRLSKADAVVRRALTGHVTEEMQRHYSNVGTDEKRAAIAGAHQVLAHAKEVNNRNPPEESVNSGVNGGSGAASRLDRADESGRISTALRD